ncbi:hypothetical protein [Streptomyces sp. NPDC017958]|uniref:hypothetical protein n=1 Tax=Streptomyces sp. NPDC017958 TaxID=3365021 RepID=UPI00379AC142
MEQRIGSSSKPVEGAGFDPAFIPGLTAPAAKSEQEQEPQAAAPEPAEEPEPEQEQEQEPKAKAAEAPAEPEEEEEAPADGPVFEASDRRAKFAADHRGVRLSLDEENCEFRWEEIAAVETESPRFGKRFTITVHTPDRRWYPIEIEATARARFKEWEDRLDAVLDAYFEEA